MKDPTSETYSRSVQKIFVVFSFMGGLIGAIMTALFMVNAYTNFAYEIALSIDIFEVNRTLEEDKVYKAKSISVNLLHFIKLSAYELLRKLTKKINSPLYNHMC